MKLFLTAALSCSMLCTVVASPLRAASEVDVAPAATFEAATETKIVLQNVKPSLMQSWLQPDVHSTVQIPVSSVSSEKFEIPKGVERFEADDATNTLRVLANEEGLEKLREIIGMLDKPIPQIEVQIKLLQMPKESARAINGISSIDGSPVKGAQVTISRSPHLDIDKLIATGKARLISAPRVTTFNNTEVAIASLPRGAYAESRDENGKLRGYFPVGWQQKFVVVPTLGRDGIINLTSQIVIGYFSIEENGKAKIVKQLPLGMTHIKNLLSQQISTSAQIKDGDTIFIGGMKVHETEENGAPTSDEYIVSLTAREIHLTDDPIAADATSSTR